ncbi:MAG TPA: hypothetical protein VN639_01515 [Azonexus sp.]|nr:hypothetical protein [Azonexus sp.]
MNIKFYSVSPVVKGLIAIASLALSSQPLFAATPRGFVDRGGESADMAPTGKGWGELRGTGSKEIANFPGNASSGHARPKPGGGSNNGISYRGGPVMVNANGVNVYYIWYGNWSGDSTAQTILSDLAASIGGSPYFNINTGYYDANNKYVVNKVTWVGTNMQATRNPSGGSDNALSDSDIQKVVTQQFTQNGGPLTPDPNGVYFVLTARDVTATSGFCSKYCGWHTYTTVGTTKVKYSFVGNPVSQCPSSCSAQSTSPNGDPGADAMASVIAHELEEAVTDPELNAWYDTRGYENADKCAWNFGTTKVAPNGSKYNMTLGSRQYLIQQNWVNAGGGYCSQAY